MHHSPSNYPLYSWGHISKLYSATSFVARSRQNISIRQSSQTATPIRERTLYCAYLPTFSTWKTYSGRSPTRMPPISATRTSCNGKGINPKIAQLDKADYAPSILSIINAAASNNARKTVTQDANPSTGPVPENNFDDKRHILVGALINSIPRDFFNLFIRPGCKPVLFKLIQGIKNI